VHTGLPRFWALLLLATFMSAGDAVPAAGMPRQVELIAPLTTVVELSSAVSGGRRLNVDLDVPADAPRDLGIGVYVEDRDGTWYQRAAPGVLLPGRRSVSFDLGGQDGVAAEPSRSLWTPEAATVSDRTGIYFWSAADSRATIGIVAMSLVPLPAIGAAQRLADLHLPGMAADGRIHARLGERWQLELRPDPWPANPYDPDVFRLDALITTPDGRVLRIPAFCDQPMRGSDRGDREDVVAGGPPRFAVRFRPAQTGLHRLRLVASWAGGVERTIVLPDVLAEGGAAVDYVRVDPEDPRFFRVGESMWWPVGLNLHSTYDKRSQEANGTKLTPPRGSLVYSAMFDRLAAAGGNAAEIWMSSWNLALEWRADWPGYQGLSRYAQGNAWRLDRVLDHAWSRGIRINLVINNHGQASPNNDREWKDNPYNVRIGGPLAEAIELFEHPIALAGQERLRRYIIARFADHPAILGWKLWSEVDLTAARGELVPRWHEQAAERWHELDVYEHPVTTHWAGDFRRVNPAVADLPGIDYLCIDAYRRPGPAGTWRLLADILADSTQYPNRGLSRYRKPCLVTEFGAGSGASPESCRAVDHRTGAWAAFVTGHAGAPMLWWWEWVDQGERWQPYGAIQRFIVGEDLRGREARCVELAAGWPSGDLWARAWVRPGRLLAYIQDPAWGSMGGEPEHIESAWLEISPQSSAGRMQVEWWDCDRGERISVQDVVHPGGQLRLACPAFAGHLACKLQRLPEAVQ
jgi:hypothetical protein